MRLPPYSYLELIGKDGRPLPALYPAISAITGDAMVFSAPRRTFTAGDVLLVRGHAEAGGRLVADTQYRDTVKRGGLTGDIPLLVATVRERQTPDSMPQLVLLALGDVDGDLLSPEQREVLMVAAPKVGGIEAVTERFREIEALRADAVLLRQPAPLDELLRGVCRVYGPAQHPPKMNMQIELGRPVYLAEPAQLYVAVAYVDLPALQEREAALMHLIHSTPPLSAALVSGQPDQTSYISLGGLLDDQGRALSLMACLVALGRAELMTLATLDDGLDYATVRRAAGMGLLSLYNVNLAPYPAAQSVDAPPP